jgi:hypothetical protein
MSTRTTVRYEDDFYTWSQEQAAALRRAAAARVNLPDAIDFENLAEEVESLGMEQVRELWRRYRVLLLHLLKWQYRPGERAPDWRVTIRTQRDELARLLEISPGLKPKRRAELAEAYAAAREDAADETELPLERFPEQCPYRLEEVESGTFWPGEGR